MSIMHPLSRRKKGLKKSGFKAMALFLVVSFLSTNGVGTSSRGLLLASNPELLAPTRNIDTSWQRWGFKHPTIDLTPPAAAPQKAVASSPALTRILQATAAVAILLVSPTRTEASDLIPTLMETISQQMTSASSLDLLMLSLGGILNGVLGYKLFRTSCERVIQLFKVENFADPEVLTENRLTAAEDFLGDKEKPFSFKTAAWVMGAIFVVLTVKVTPLPLLTLGPLLIAGSIGVFQGLWDAQRHEAAFYLLRYKPEAAAKLTNVNPSAIPLIFDVPRLKEPFDRDTREYLQAAILAMHEERPRATISKLLKVLKRTRKEGAFVEVLKILIELKEKCSEREVERIKGALVRARKTVKKRKWSVEAKVELWMTRSDYELPDMASEGKSLRDAEARTARTFEQLWHLTAELTRPEEDEQTQKAIALRLYQENPSFAQALNGEGLRQANKDQFIGIFKILHWLYEETEIAKNPTDRLEASVLIEAIQKARKKRQERLEWNAGQLPAAVRAVSLIHEPSAELTQVLFDTAINEGSHAEGSSVQKAAAVVIFNVIPGSMEIEQAQAYRAAIERSILKPGTRERFHDALDAALYSSFFFEYILPDSNQTEALRSEIEKRAFLQKTERHLLTRALMNDIATKERFDPIRNAIIHVLSASSIPGAPEPVDQETRRRVALFAERLSGEILKPALLTLIAILLDEEDLEEETVKTFVEILKRNKLILSMHDLVMCNRVLESIARNAKAVEEPAAEGEPALALSLGSESVAREPDEGEAPAGMHSLVSKGGDEPAAAEPTAKKIGDYTIIRELGRGGMGVVYEAEGPDHEHVALKVVETGKGRRQARFVREVEAIQRLEHPNIIRILDTGHDNGNSYYTMPLEEMALAKRLKKLRTIKERLSTEETLKIALQIAAGLAHAHEHGIIHRDVKPENILLDAEGHVLLADFGLARQEGEARLTVDGGAVLGTVQYMAPEQLMVEEVDHRTDIYALGLLLAEMVLGKPAVSETVQARSHKEKEELQKKLEGILEKMGKEDDQERDAILKIAIQAVSVEADQRQESVVEIIAALETIQSKGTTAAAVVETEAAASSGEPAAAATSGEGTNEPEKLKISSIKRDTWRRMVERAKESGGSEVKLRAIAQDAIDTRKVLTLRGLVDHLWKRLRAIERGEEEAGTDAEEEAAEPGEAAPEAGEELELGATGRGRPLKNLQRGILPLERIPSSIPRKIFFKMNEVLKWLRREGLFSTLSYRQKPIYFYFFNANVQSEEDYLLGFNRAEENTKTVGLAVDFIKFLMNLQELRDESGNIVLIEPGRNFVNQADRELLIREYTFHEIHCQSGLDLRGHKALCERQHTQLQHLFGTQNLFKHAARMFINSRAGEQEASQAAELPFELENATPRPSLKLSPYLQVESAL